MNDPIVPVGGGVPVDPETGERYGYLPRKAASRKLVIRAQLGMAWVVGALAAAAILGVAAVVFLLSRPNVPKAPYTEEGRLTDYPEQAVQPLPNADGWLDRRTGLAVVAGALSFCPEDGGWVGPDGRRYDAEGRSDTGTGLTLWAVKAASGRVYVDRTTTTTVTGAAEPLAPCERPWRVSDPEPPSGL